MQLSSNPAFEKVEKSGEQITDRTSRSEISFQKNPKLFTGCQAIIKRKNL